MGRELYFIKFNKQLAKENLSKTLQEKSKYSYQNFITENIYNKEISFEKVLQKAENDIEKVNLEELWSLFLWLDWKISTAYKNVGYAKIESIFAKEMTRNGLHIFYEIPSKTPAWHFFSFLGNYQSLRKTDFHYIFHSVYFNDFLDYAITYIGFVVQMLIKEYYGMEEGRYFEEFWLIEGDLYQVLEKNPSQYELGSEAFEKQENKYLEAIQKIKKFKETPKKMMTTSIYNEYKEIAYTEEGVFTLNNQFYTFTSLKKALGDYKGLIKILDSY